MKQGGWRLRREERNVCVCVCMRTHAQRKQKEHGRDCDEGRERRMQRKRDERKREAEEKQKRRNKKNEHPKWMEITRIVIHTSIQNKVCCNPWLVFQKQIQQQCQRWTLKCWWRSHWMQWDFAIEFNGIRLSLIKWHFQKRTRDFGTQVPLPFSLQATGRHMKHDTRWENFLNVPRQQCSWEYLKYPSNPLCIHPHISVPTHPPIPLSTYPSIHPSAHVLTWSSSPYYLSTSHYLEVPDSLTLNSC